eukprot:3888533-Prymnesium_polylepis.1
MCVWGGGVTAWDERARPATQAHRRGREGADPAHVVMRARTRSRYRRTFSREGRGDPLQGENNRRWHDSTGLGVLCTRLAPCSYGYP